jgi:hypothetical protein
VLNAGSYIILDRLVEGERLRGGSLRIIRLTRQAELRSARPRWIKLDREENAAFVEVLDFVGISDGELAIWLAVLPEIGMMITSV